MTHLERQHKRKAIVGTILIHILILIGFYFLKLNYTKVEEDRGIAINFGYISDSDARNDIPMRSTKNTIKSVPTQPKQSIKENVPDITVKDAVTQDTEDVIAVDDTKEAQIETEEDSKQDTPVEIVPEVPVPDENLKNALASLLGAESTSPKGKNDTEESPSGNIEGQENGDSESKILGSGTQKNAYDLGNRRALKTPNPDYLCNEIGVVVVRVWVNSAGITTKAEAGIRGSTDTSPCLIKEAKEAALNTIWAPDPEAVQTQIGTITYNFYKR
jgi:hypothetical protein